MKYNLMGLLRYASNSLRAREGGTAYALAELANNLRLLMRGECTMEDFKRCYVGEDGEPLDLDKLFPAPADAD